MADNNADLQYQVLAVVQNFIINNLALPAEWDESLSPTNVMIVDEEGPIPEFRTHTYIQVFDAVGTQGIFQGGGNMALEWEIGVSIRKGFMIDAPYRTIYANQQLRQVSWSLYQVLNLQYVMDPSRLLIPEPLHLSNISRPKKTKGKSVPIELMMVHRYKHRLFSPWQAVV